MPQSSRFMIYGANGYTGRLVAELARSRGLSPILAGRNAAAVEEVARPLGMEWRAFGLEDADAIVRSLQGVAAVLHCAGPFVRTARPMLEACAAARVHYLDITGEIDVFEWIFANTQRWKDTGITALPGAGFDVVPTDGVAAMLKKELPDATRLQLAFRTRGGGLSPGTTRTALLSAPAGCRARVGGVIVEVPFRVERFAFQPGGKVSGAGLLAWGDVSTAFHSTGIRDIEVFLGGPDAFVRNLEPRGVMKWLLSRGPVVKLAEAVVSRVVKGPTAAEQERAETWVYGRASNARGDVREKWLRAPETYRFTAHSALALVQLAVEGRLPAGAQTPSTAAGAEFVTTLEGVRVVAATG